MRGALSVLVVAMAAVAATGCGGARKPAAGPATSPRSGSAPARHPGDSAATRVIRAWSDAERAGRFDRAASYFALPVVVANGTPPFQLRTRSGVLAFQRALPCGARLLRTIDDGGYTVATFRLATRPGARCDGVGAVAYTAFQVRRGRITQWIRVPGEAAPGRVQPVPPGGESPPPDTSPAV